MPFLEASRKPPSRVKRGLRRVERGLLLAGMGAAAFFVERRLMRALRRRQVGSSDLEGPGAADLG